MSTSALDITAYCDESATDHKVYCIAGYWAGTQKWAKLEAPWREALAAEGLSEFHAVDCEHGKGQFKGRSRPDRARIHKAFIDLIGTAGLKGVWAAIDLRGWDEVKDRVVELRSRDGMANPHYIVFQALVERICLGLEDLPAPELLELVFDDRPESGKVLNLYYSLRAAKEPDLQFVTQRLGGIARQASNESPALQAADILAYEIKRRFDNPTKSDLAERAKLMEGHERWQLVDLNGHLLNGDYIPRKRIHSKLMPVLEKRFGSDEAQPEASNGG